MVNTRSVRAVGSHHFTPSWRVPISDSVGITFLFFHGKEGSPPLFFVLFCLGFVSFHLSHKRSMNREG